MGRPSAQRATPRDRPSPRTVSARVPPIIAKNMADPFFERFVRLVAPSPPAMYTGRVHLQHATLPRAKNEGWQWRCHNEPLDLARALGAHVTAGALTDEPQPYRDRYGDDRDKTINAVGLCAAPGERCGYANIDLDGVYYVPVLLVVALRNTLRERPDAPDPMMVTSSSGRPGRYRVLVRLASELSVVQLQTCMARLLTALGYPPRAGGVEVYPSTHNGRLPFGRGGCEVFTDAALVHRERHHPLTLVERFFHLPAVDLVAALERARRAAPAVPRLPQRPAAPRAPTHPVHAPMPPVRRLRPLVGSGVLNRAQIAAQARVLLDQGVSGPGERYRARYILAMDARYRGTPLRQAVADYCDWVHRGGIGRSRLGRQRRGVAREVREAEAAFRHIYNRPLNTSQTVAHLTRGEIACVVGIAEHTAARGYVAAEVCHFLLLRLPAFKGAALAGMDDTPMHHDQWADGVSRRWAELRAACELFELPPRSHYVPQACDPTNAHPYRWRIRPGAFAFDPAPAPARALVATRARTPRQVYSAARLCTGTRMCDSTARRR